MGEHNIKKKDVKKKKTTTKTKKQKNPAPSRNRVNRPSWLDVPLKKGPTVLQNLSGIGGVTKSWRTATSPSCAGGAQHPRMPHLIEINISPTPTTPCRKIKSSQNDDGFGHYYTRMQLYRRSGQGIFFKGYSHQDLFVLDADLSHCYTHSNGLVFLPNWDCTVPFKLATSSSYDGDVMVITGVSSPAFGFFSKSKKKREWTMENCRAIEPYSTGKYMEFTNAIGSGGKYYAISLQGSLAVIENEEIVALGKNRAVPSTKGARRFREHLVEYEEGIYLVFLISRKSINVVDDVEVLRLDVSNGYWWEKVESLPGDAVFFVGDKCCLGISASLVGCGGNLVYFTHDRAVRDGGGDNKSSNKWFVYDMGKRCIFPTRGPEVDLTESHTPGLFVSAMDYH